MITEIRVERAVGSDLAAGKRCRFSPFFVLRKADSYELYKKKPAFVNVAEVDISDTTRIMVLLEGYLCSCFTEKTPNLTLTY